MQPSFYLVVVATHAIVIQVHNWGIGYTKEQHFLLSLIKSYGYQEYDSWWTITAYWWLLIDDNVLLWLGRLYI